MIDSNIGPSVQAQPTNLPSVERNKSNSSGSVQSDISSPAKSSQTSSRSGTVSSSPTSSAPQSSSSSGTSSSNSGYPPSSSHTSSSPDDPSPSDNQSGTPRSEGTDSQRPLPTDDVSDGSSRERKDESQAHPTKEDMETTGSSSSQIEASVPQGSSQTDENQAEGTQDSFLGRKNDSGSFSSRDGAGSSYSAGSSSASVFVSATCSVSTPTTGSLSAPLATVSDSQETIENSVSCVEDSVSLSLDEMRSVSSKRPSTSGALKSVSQAAAVHQTSSESEEIRKADLLKHKGDDSGCEADNSSARHLLVEGLKDVGEQHIVNKDVSSELLPLENPQSPELLNDGSEETDDEDLMDAPNSPEIAIQAPKLPQNRSLFQAHCSAEIKESHTNTQTLRNIEKSSAKSRALVEDATESSQAMETDMISTQSSFVLQLAESQCSIAPVSPIKSDVSEDVEEGGGSSKSAGVVVASLEEIEEYEKEFPSLVKVQQCDEEAMKDDVSLQTRQEAVGKQLDNSKPSDCKSNSTSCPNIPPITSDNELGSNRSPKLQLDALAKTKPVPLYESLECDDSVSEGLSNQVIRAQLRDDSQQSVNTSQGTGSGEYSINFLSAWSETYSFVYRCHLKYRRFLYQTNSMSTPIVVYGSNPFLCIHQIYIFFYMHTCRYSFSDSSASGKPATSVQHDPSITEASSPIPHGLHHIGFRTTQAIQPFWL